VTDPAALEDESVDLHAVATAPLTIAAVAAPPALFVLAGAAALVRRRRRDRDGAAAHRRRALPDARAALRDASSPDDVSAAIREYLRRRWPLADPPVTVETLEAHLPSERAPVAAKLAELEHRCDAARFGGASVDTRALAVEAESLLEALDAGKETR
jgi:hypothetical protein